VLCPRFWSAFPKCEPDPVSPEGCSRIPHWHQWDQEDLYILIELFQLLGSFLAWLAFYTSPLATLSELSAPEAGSTSQATEGSRFHVTAAQAWCAWSWRQFPGRKPQNSLSGFLPDEGVFKKSRINATFRLACIAPRDTMRVGDSWWVLLWVQVSEPWRPHHHLHRILSHAAVPLCQHFHGCYDIYGDWGRAVGLRLCQILGSAGANHSWVRVCYGMEKPLTEPGCSPQSCLWRYRWWRQQFPRVFLSPVSTQ